MFSSTAVPVLMKAHYLLHQFPFVTVTNYHEFSGLNNTKIQSYNSGGQKSKMSFMGPKSRCWSGWVPPTGSGVDTSSLSPLDTALTTISLQENADRKFVTYKPRGVPPTLPRSMFGTLWIQLHQSSGRRGTHISFIPPSWQCTQRRMSILTKPRSTPQPPL